MAFGTLTRKGRVVYDRKKHPFTWCDARRILRSLDEPEKINKQMGCFLETVDRSLDFLPPEIREKTVETADFGPISADFAIFVLETAIAEAWSEFDGFGGGDFGGGGASREFGDDTELPPEGERGRETGNPFEIGPCGVPFIIQPFQGHCR